MTFDNILVLLGLTLAAAWTPGPNNMMLAASGVNYGLRATIPHILGITVGFAIMLFLIAIGLGSAFSRFPFLYEILRWVGAGMLIWVAWKIATAKRPGEASVATKPFSFVQAAAFQWVNPKAWIICTSLSSQFLNPEHPVMTALILVGISILGGLTSASGWAWFGMILANWLNTPGRLKVFNWGMAATILLGVMILVFGDLQ